MKSCILYRSQRENIEVRTHFSFWNEFRVDVRSDRNVLLLLNHLSVVNPELSIVLFIHQGNRRRGLFSPFLTTPISVRESNTECYELKVPEGCVRPHYCAYCGNAICSEPHCDLKIIELWSNPDAWLPFGGDLFISKTQKTRFHGESSIEELIFLLDFNLQTAFFYNKTKQILYQPLPYQKPVLQSFCLVKNPRIVFPLHVWGLRSFLKGGLCWKRITSLLPLPILECYQDTFEIIKALSKCPRGERCSLLPDHTPVQRAL